jgi:flagellum-specific ATP synthase
MRNIVGPEHIHLSEIFREHMAIYRDAEDLINIGAYKEGANKKIDQAIRLNDPISSFLKQSVEDPCDMAESLNRLSSTLNGVEG